MTTGLKVTTDMPITRSISKLYAAEVPPVLVAIMIHAGLDIVLIAHRWHFGEPLLTLGALAIPISQNGLVAIWAGMHSSPSYVRLVGLSLGLFTSWYLATSLLPMNSEVVQGAGWGMALVVQALLVVLLVTLLRPAGACRTGRDVSGTANPNRFSLATLLLWTAALTVPLVLLRLAVDQFGWTLRVFDWEFLPQLILVGVFNGVFGVVVLTSLKLRGPLWLHVACGSAVVLLLCVLETYLFQLAFTPSGGMDLANAVRFAGAQLVVLYGTLGLVQWAARGDKRRGRSYHFEAAATVSIDDVQITPAEPGLRRGG